MGKRKKWMSDFFNVAIYKVLELELINSQI